MKNITIKILAILLLGANYIVAQDNGSGTYSNVYLNNKSNLMKVKEILEDSVTISQPQLSNTGKFLDNNGREININTYYSNDAYNSHVDSAEVILYHLYLKSNNIDTSPNKSHKTAGPSHANNPKVPSVTPNGAMPLNSNSSQKNHGPSLFFEDITVENGGDGLNSNPPTMPNAFKIEVRQYIALIYGRTYREDTLINGSSKFSTKYRYLDSISNHYSNAGVSYEGTSGGSPATPAFSEANIIYGVADFFISRAKEEMVEAYVEKFYDTLYKKYVIRTLLPNSLGIMKSFIDDNSIGFSKYGNLFKASFQKDLQNIPIVIEDEYTDRYLLKNLGVSDNDLWQISSVISGIATIGNGLYQKEQLPDILDLLSSRYQLKEDSITVFNKIVFLSEITNRTLVSVKDPESGGSQNDRIFSFVDPRIIVNLSPQEMNIWVNLIEVNNYKMFTKIDANIVDNIDLKREKFESYLLEFSNLYTSLEQTIKMENDSKKSLTDVDVSNLLNNSTAIVSKSLDFIKKNTTIFGTPSVIPDWLNKATNSITYISEIHQGVITKQYGDVLHGTVSLLNMYASKADSGIIDKLNRYGSFVVNILMAKSDSAVSAALDELIPHDSYKIKYMSSISATISGYPGVQTGFEQLLSPNGSIEKAFGWEFGLSLPIGIDINSKLDRYTSSWGVFFQVFDLGAVMSYRLTNNDSSSSSHTTVNAVPQITFKQILSPGLFLLARPGRSPLTFGVGVEFTPDLRSIQTSGITTEANSFRYEFTLGIDVTALTLFAKTK